MWVVLIPGFSLYTVTNLSSTLTQYTDRRNVTLEEYVTLFFQLEAILARTENLESKDTICQRDPPKWLNTLY